MMNTKNISTPKLLIQNGYQYHSLIGEGSNGKTFRAINKKTGETVAIKALKFSENLKNYELFKREAEVLQTINVPGVPKFYDFITSETEFTECWIVQEYIDGKSILDMLEEKNGKCFSLKETLEIIYDAVEIIKVLQTAYVPPIIHRDIKPSNILISQNKENKRSIHLIDFGAVANPQKRSSQSTIAGTVGYMAPEQLLGDCSIQSDYYAIGATMLHMLTGIAPADFPTDGFQLQFETILKEKVPYIPDSFIQFMKSLLAPKSADRPHNASELQRQLYELIDNYNQSIEGQYQKLTKKCKKWSIYEHTKGLEYAMSLINLILLRGICTSVILSAICFIIFIDNLHLVEQNTLHNGLFMLGLFIVTSVIIVTTYPRNHRKWKQLTEQLEALNYIDIPDALPNKEIEDSDSKLLASKLNYTIVKGTIAAVKGNEIEYYYYTENKKQCLCNTMKFTETLRKKATQNGIKLTVGEIVDIGYQTVTEDYTPVIYSHIILI